MPRRRRPHTLNSILRLTTLEARDVPATLTVNVKGDNVRGREFRRADQPRRRD
jgi:hypothetical protein